MNADEVRADQTGSNQPDRLAAAGRSAFPWCSHGGVHEHQYIEAGMTLLDFFAAHAMTGFLAMQADPDIQERPEHGELAKVCYKYAQAMLTERARVMEAKP